MTFLEIVGSKGPTIVIESQEEREQIAAELLQLFPEDASIADKIRSATRVRISREDDGCQFWVTETD